MPMTPKEINEALRNAGVTQSDISRNLKPSVTQPAVNQVVHKRQTSKRIQDAICSAIGKTWEEVFG